MKRRIGGRWTKCKYNNLRPKVKTESLKKKKTGKRGRGENMKLRRDVKIRIKSQIYRPRSFSLYTATHTDYALSHRPRHEVFLFIVHHHYYNIIKCISLHKLRRKIII